MGRSCVEPVDGYGSARENLSAADSQSVPGDGKNADADARFDSALPRAIKLEFLSI